MECVNCGRFAMYDAGGSALCLECAIKHNALIAKQTDAAEREMNHAVAEMEFISGQRGLPRFPERPAQIHVIAAGNTLNHINITGSTVGSLNTGTLVAIDSAVGNIERAGEAEVARAFKRLTEAISADPDLSSESRDEALEILELVSNEVVLPEDRRRRPVMKRLLQNFGQLLTSSTALVNLWQSLGPSIQRLFS